MVEPTDHEARKTPSERASEVQDQSGPGSSQQPSQQQKSWQRGFASAWMVLGAAPSGLLIGYFIDQAYGTTPGWMLGLSLLFLGVSLYQLIKDTRK